MSFAVSFSWVHEVVYQIQTHIANIHTLPMLSGCSSSSSSRSSGGSASSSDAGNRHLSVFGGYGIRVFNSSGCTAVCAVV